MDNGYKLGLGAVAVIVFCCTATIAMMFIALWQDRNIVAWCILGLIILVILVLLIRCFNEMSLRRKRYNHQSEIPLDAHGYPTILQPGQQPYQWYYVPTRYDEGQPHDREEVRHVYE